MYVYCAHFPPIFVVLSGYFAIVTLPQWYVQRFNVTTFANWLFCKREKYALFLCLSEIKSKKQMSRYLFVILFKNCMAWLRWCLWLLVVTKRFSSCKGDAWNRSRNRNDFLTLQQSVTVTLHNTGTRLPPNQ